MARHGFNWWRFVHQSGGGSYIEPPMVVNGSCVTLKGYITDMIADDAIRFVQAHARDRAPWYLGVHFTSPHAPYVGSDGTAASMHPPHIVAQYANTPFHSVPDLPFDSENYTDSSFAGCFSGAGRSECLKGYFAAVTAMDAAIGRVLDAVEASRVLDQTIVIFTSGHGFNTGHHGLWGKGNGAWPLNMVETSLKVPSSFGGPKGASQPVHESTSVSSMSTSHRRCLSSLVSARLCRGRQAAPTPPSYSMPRSPLPSILWSTPPPR